MRYVPPSVYCVLSEIFVWLRGTGTDIGARTARSLVPSRRYIGRVIADEAEVEWRVYSGGPEGAEEGCAVEESARAWCGALRVLSGACARDLREQRLDHLEQLRAALQVASQ